MTVSSSPLLVVTLSNIGDLVMTTPVLETLHQLYPKTPIDIVADRRSSSLLRATPYVANIFHREKRAGPAAQLALLRLLRQTRYTLVIDLRTQLIPYLLRAERRLVRRGGRRAEQHAVEDHFDVIRPLLSQAIEPPACRLYLDSESEASADRALATLPGNRWLAVAPGANWPGKRWAPDAFRALLDQLSDNYDAAVILGSEEDRDAASALLEAKLPAADFTGQSTLPHAAALLHRCSAFVGNDSGLGHMAAALEVPTVTVFGPGEPNRYRPWGPHARVALAPGGNLAALNVSEVAAMLGDIDNRSSACA